jgi:hypothetical protein
MLGRRAATVVMLIVCAAGARAQSSLPRSLGDGEFARLMTALSEPGGAFADENFVSNELGLERLLPAIEREHGPGGVYVGVGPEQNFSYIAALKPRIAFVLDIRRQNLVEQLLYKALFELSDNRADFLSLLFSRPRPEGLGRDSTAAELMRAFRVADRDEALFGSTLARVLEHLSVQRGLVVDERDRAALVKVLRAFYAAGPDIAYVYGDTDDWHPNYVQLMDQTDAEGRNFSFLGSAARFLTVRELELRNLIVPVVGDFAGPTALRGIGDYLREHDDAIDVFYVSNVEPYLFSEGIWQAFYENVSALPVEPGGIFIRTFFGSTVRECGDPGVSTRVPMQGSITGLLRELDAGRLRTECDLIGLSR